MLPAGHFSMMMHMAGGTLARQIGVPIPVGTPCVANVSLINTPRGLMPAGGLSAHRMYARGQRGNREMWNVMISRGNTGDIEPAAAVSDV
jgi:hypothetical protein